MYIQEISIAINTNEDKGKLVEEFDLLMGYYRGSGQIQGRIQSQYINDYELVCLPYTLEKKSLEPLFDNLYVNKQKEKIEELCNSTFKFKIVGKSVDDYKNPCICKKSDFYILITNYVSIDSPIICGNCNESVPLYKLPAYYDYGYMPILSWETNYIACDRLQMNCEVGEHWALNQMEKLNSKLSKQGLEICKKITELTQVPTYYYLYNWKKYKGDSVSRPCPNCNQKWALKKSLHNLYDFKCDNCKIISNLSSNS